MSRLTFASARLFATLLVLSIGCDRQPAPAPVESAAPPAPPATVSSTKPIVCQPQLTWADGNLTHQGTGFFARAPGGRVAAVSSAHFLNFDGPPLVSSQWLDIATGDVVADMTTAWTVPDRHAFSTTLENDYWLMPVGDADAKRVEDQYAVLEFDLRAVPVVGEKIWFPNKDDAAALGYTKVTGSIVHVIPEQLVVRLDDDVKLQSQSGSPFISAETGRVVGVLSGGTFFGGGNAILLAPVARMRDALSQALNFPALKDVIGKP